jgi:hypothetical protein
MSSRGLHSSSEPQTPWGRETMTSLYSIDSFGTESPLTRFPTSSTLNLGRTQSQSTLAPLVIELDELEPQSDTNKFPDGGRQAWLVAAGTAGIMFCSLGYTNSFGVFQAHYMRYQLRDYSPNDISWIGSTQGFLVFASGAIGGPIFDRYGAVVSRFVFPPQLPSTDKIWRSSPQLQFSTSPPSC